MKRFIVAITGASGVLYGTRLVEAMLRAPDHEVHLIISPSGCRVMTDELGVQPVLSPFTPESFLCVNPEQKQRLHYHRFQDIGAGPASGTFRFDAMIICPATVKTVAAIAAGIADNLITRTADVALKEGRPLMMVPRETPFSVIHLENMLRLARAGGIILPACPGFYHHPKTIEDLVRFIVQKVFDRLGLELPDPIRWGKNDGSPVSPPEGNEQ
jgi:4-hydroxy-3-polyprenylbenzoate decarboxylase